MGLQEHINALPLRRSWEIPSSEENICCIALQQDLDKLIPLVKNFPALKIRLILVPDLSEKGSMRLQLPTEQGPTSIPLANLQTTASIPPWKKLILCRPDASGAAVAAIFCRYLATRGIERVLLYGGCPRTFGVQPPLPDFFSRYAEQLQEVYDQLADDASREAYAGRIKALMTGNAGWLPLALHQEYYHPHVHPERGDIMLDGGVSDMVGAQEQFAQSVGTDGHIFGFEPLPGMAELARQQLAAFPCYHLQAMGLGDAPGEVRFRYLRDSSRIAENCGDEDSVLCQMTSIDAFVRKHHLGRVDCIKLDVEGAEMLALSGGKETIAKLLPKLIVCLYHQPEDMVNIPLYIRKIAPSYKLYVAHSSAVFTDTILYARPA